MVAAVAALMATACATGPGAPPANDAIADDYMRTPGAHAERPGKHSTTTGRHGTTGTVGGGINEQSGSEAAPSEHPTIDRREAEEPAQ